MTPRALPAIANASKLEARHIQITRIAAMRLHRFQTTDGGVLASISADAIARVCLAKALTSISDGGRIEFDQNALAEALNAALAQLRPVTSLDEEVTVSIRSMQSASAGGSHDARDIVIRFNQAIGGLAVEPGGVVVIDARSGTMKAFTASLVRAAADIKDRRLWLDDRRARQLAQAALSPQVRGQAIRVSESDLTSAYRSETHVEPQWVFEFTVDEEPFTARVNRRGGRSIYTRP